MSIIKTKSFNLAIYSRGHSSANKFALVLPGKLGTKDYPHMHSHVEYLAKKGFLALTFDPPGTWESPGDISLYTMTNYILAANELIELYGNKPTFIMGHSFGGAIALYVGLTNSSVTHFAQVMSGISYKTGGHGEKADKEWQATGYRLSTRDMPINTNKTREFRLPFSFEEDRINFDMTEQLKKATKPKLFILGKDDQLVKPSEVKSNYKLAAKPKELFELEYGHDYRRNEKMINLVNKAIGNFLEKYSF